MTNRKFVGKEYLLNDSWIVDLREAHYKIIRKQEKKTGKEMKKIKRYDFYGNEINEQQYLSQEIEKLKTTINIYVEEIELLKVLNKQDYLLISPDLLTYIKELDKCLNPFEARKWAKENGYEYIKPFDQLGELWVKKGK